MKIIKQKVFKIIFDDMYSSNKEELIEANSFSEALDIVKLHYSEPQFQLKSIELFNLSVIRFLN